MLPDINLDNETYEDMIDAARNMIISLYPEWTDYNYHDPGITLIELFAWMKESQQYYMDQIGAEHKRSYLKLLGIEKRHKRPALTLGQIQVPEDISIMEGMKLYAGNICFETDVSRYLFYGDIACLFSQSLTGEWRGVGREQIAFGRLLGFLPFGSEPTEGNIFYVGFDGPVPEGEKLILYADMTKEQSVPRNWITEGMYPPLAAVSWEYRAKGGWRECQVLWDETHCFLQKGFVGLSLDQPMEKEVICGYNGYFVRCVLKECHYDTAPEISCASVNISRAVQKDTCAAFKDFPLPEKGEIRLGTYLGLTGVSQVFLKRSQGYYLWENFESFLDEEGESMVFSLKTEEFPEDTEEIRVVSMNYKTFLSQEIGEGNGFPCQEIFLEDQEILWESMEILVQDVLDKECYHHWRRVEDFGSSLPESMDYRFDSEKGVIRFGDCIHGMAPEGRILLISCARSLGSGGNIKTGKLNRLGLASQDFLVENIEDGLGGMDEESLEDSFLRARRSIQDSQCAVSDQDYETLVKQTPGLMIESCHVIPFDQMKSFFRGGNPSMVYMVVKPFTPSGRGTISSQYERNIRHYLEQFCLLGQGILILQPEYIELSVYCEVSLKAQYSNLKQQVEKEIRSWLSRYETEFGAFISYSRLYGALDRMEAVAAVKTLDLDTKGNQVRYNASGDLILPPNGILWLGEVKCSFSIDE